MSTGKPIDLSGEVGLMDFMPTKPKRQMKARLFTFSVMVKSRLLGGSMTAEVRTYVIKAKGHGHAVALVEKAHRSDYADWHIYSIEAKGGWPYSLWIDGARKRSKAMLDSVAGRSTRKLVSTATRRRSS